MTTIFADTAYYVALANRRDTLHDLAVAFLSGFSGRIVTTDYVLWEVANSLRRAAFRQAFLDLLETIRSDPDTEVVPAGPDLFRAGLDLFADRPDKDWSLTDCLSFVVMTERGLTDAVTSDHHFEQAGFRILLK